MNKIIAIVNLLRKGSEVSNPGAWKNAEILASFLLAMVAAAAAFGAPIDLTGDQVADIAAAIIAIANAVLTVISSKKVGILPASPPDLPKVEVSTQPEPTPGEGHDFMKGTQ